MILHRFYTGSDCLRHWLTLDVPRWIAPERVASAIACTRSALPFIAALPLLPLTVPTAPRIYAPAPFVAGGFGLPAYGLGDFYIPGVPDFPGSAGTETAAEGYSALTRGSFLVPEVPPSVGGDVATGATEGVGDLTPTLAPGGSPGSFSQPDMQQPGATGPTITPQPVPEPGTLALAAVALVIVWAAGLVGRG